MVYLNLASLMRKGWKFWAVFTGSLVFIGVVVWIGPVFPSSEDGVKMLFYLYLGFAFGLYWFMSGFGSMKRMNLVKDTPTSKVRSIAMGLVELFGTVVPSGEGVLESPFSGRDCVFYRFVVEEYRRSRKNSYWETVCSGTKGNRFYLEDETGRVLVDPEGADLHIPQDKQVVVSGGEEPPEEVKRFVEESPELDLEAKTMDLKLFEVSYGDKRRYTEYYVGPDEEVYVFGKAMKRPDFAGSSRNEENVVVNRDRDTPMFLISDNSEKELLDSMGSRVRWKIFGGAGLSVACLAVILAMVGLLPVAVPGGLGVVWMLVVIGVVAVLAIAAGVWWYKRYKEGYGHIHGF